MRIENTNRKLLNHCAVKGAVILLLFSTLINNSVAESVMSWDLGDYNNDGLQSDISLGSTPTPSPTGESANTFGSTGETGCVNASDGNTCDPILFNTGAIGENVFTTGFDLITGIAFPITTGPMSADITNGVLTFSALPFGVIQPSTSGDTEIFLPPGSFPVIGYSGATSDFSYLTVEDVTSLGNGQYGVVVNWLHQGPSCAGCFDSNDVRIRLEGIMTVASAPQPSTACKGSAVRACVGECGNPFIESHVVSADDVILSAKKKHADFCLQLDQSATNLCPSEDIRYQLSVNGRVRASGEIGYGFGETDSGDLITVAAKEGDLVTVELEHFFDHPGINCFLLGEAYLDLGYVNKK